MSLRPLRSSCCESDASTIELQRLELGHIPPTISQTQSFPFLRSLKIGWAFLHSPAAGFVQLLRALPETLAELRFPAIELGSEVELVTELKRFAKNLTELEIHLDATPPESPLFTVFAECSSLKSLSIIVPDLGLLGRLLSQLPKSTLTSIFYESKTEFFLESYPDSADDLEALLSLPQLSKLKRFQLDLISDGGDDPDEEMEDPPGDEDGRFVDCMYRWEAKGLQLEGAYQWGFFAR